MSHLERAHQSMAWGGAGPHCAQQPCPLQPPCTALAHSGARRHPPSTRSQWLCDEHRRHSSLYQTSAAPVSGQAHAAPNGWSRPEKRWETSRKYNKHHKYGHKPAGLLCPCAHCQSTKEVQDACLRNPSFTLCWSGREERPRPPVQQ